MSVWTFDSIKTVESAMLDVRLQSWNLRSAVLVSLRSSKAECISLSSPSQEDDPSSSPKMTSDSNRLFKLGSLWTCSLWDDMATVGSIIIACNTAKEKRYYQKNHGTNLWVFVTIRVQADTTSHEVILGARLRSWVTNCVSWEPTAWYQIYTHNSPAAQWSFLYG